MAGAPGNMPGDFGTLLAGLLGTAESAQGEPAKGEMPEDALAPAVAAMAAGAVEAAADSAAHGRTEDAVLVSETPPGAPAPAAPPLTVPDLLARMPPPPQRPVPAPPAATLALATTESDARHPTGPASSASLSPPVPPMPAGPPPDVVMPAASEPRGHASEGPPAVVTEAPAGPDGRILAAAPQPAQPSRGLVTDPAAPSASPPPPAPPMPAGLPPDAAMAAAPEPHGRASEDLPAVATEAPAGPGGRIPAAASQPAPPTPALAAAPAAPHTAEPPDAPADAAFGMAAVFAPQTDTPRSLPVAAPLPPIVTSREIADSAPIAIALESPPPAAPPDPRQSAPTEAMAPAPDTLPAAAPGGASGTTVAPPEATAAPPRHTAPVPWPARQVVPFAVSLALGSDDSISLTLDPVELGRVEVAITRGAEAHVSLRAERPETLALLQRDRVELERALAGTGFGTEGRSPNLSFGLGFGGGGDDRRDRRPAARDGQAARPAQHTPAPLANQAAPTARGLIDLAF